MPPSVAELLATLARALGKQRRRWYLFGAQAVVVWGRPRMTADVDITVDLEAEDAEAFVADLDGAGFGLRVTDAADFVRRARVLPFVHRSTHLPLDVVLAGPGLEQAFLDRAQTVEMWGVAVPVISPEDLIVTKILAGRPKDVEDVGGVLRERRARLDTALIRGTLDLLERALGQSDLLRVFEAELARASEERP